MSKKLKVLDFFCGGGGFSEGFRQAGFEVIWAVDIWQPAVDTHNENHPETTAIKGDVIKLSMLPDKEFHEAIPDAEVIIGSPPCTAFSNSNKSGNGDKAKGIELIEAYLKIIARKKFKKNSILKYWILENVPKVQSHIKDSYTAKELELKGDFKLIVKGDSSGVYNAKYFGVPSSRKRFFCGDFPKPEILIKNNNELIPLKKITTALGAPKAKLTTTIVDPIYGFTLNGEDVTDHHYIQEIAEFEWKTAKRLKQDKGYMGKMSLPENENKPARTIMATMSVSARESFILKMDKDKFRTPTIREVASLMSFPIDYRFYGSSMGTKYKLVGNSVPPRMSYALARAINKEEGIRNTNKYNPITYAGNLDFINLNLNTFHINTEKPKKDTAKFKYHIPYYIYKAYRVELTNNHSDFEKRIFNWSCEIHHRQGKKAKVYVPELTNLKISKDDITKLNEFISELKTKRTSSKKFQEVLCKTSTERKTNNLLGPYELLDQIQSFLLKNFDFKNDNLKFEIPENGLPELSRPIALGYYILSKAIQTLKIYE
jgi:DNA (cytosine-5)-methyltransferase 1